MSQQTINVGAAPDDGSGDSLRLGGQKINSNFDELYAASTNYVQAVAAFAGTNASGTIASDGISVSVGNYITTGALSNHSHGDPTLALTNLSGTTASNSAGFTLSLSAGNYLTTAMASNRGSDFVQANATIAGTSISGTIASNGMSLSVGPYITTGALSNHSHGDPTLALTNLSGTTASASNGFTLSLSAAAPGAGGGFAAKGSGAYTQNTGTIEFANSNGITFGLSTNQMTASHNGLTTAAQSDHSHGNPTLALTNLSGTTASASNGLTLSLSAAAPGGAATHSYYPILGVGYVQGTTAISTPGASTVLVQPFFLPAAMSISYVRLPMSAGKVSTTGATTAARSWSLAEFNTYFVGFYSLGVGANSRSLQYVTGSNVGITFSNIYHIGAASNNQSFSYSASIPTEGTTTAYATNGNVNSANFVMNTTILSNSILGNKWLDVPMGVSLSAGAWWIAIQRSSTTGSTTAGGNFAGMTNITSRASFYAASQVNVPVLPWGVNTSASTGAAWQIGLGAWTTNTNGATSSSMALSHIISVANQPVFPINLVRQA